MNGAYTHDQNDSPPFTIRSNSMSAAGRVGCVDGRLNGRRRAQNLERQIVAADFPVLASHDQPLDDVLELANVAGPGMIGECLQRVGREPGRFDLILRAN